LRRKGMGLDQLKGFSGLEVITFRGEDIVPVRSRPANLDRVKMGEKVRYYTVCVDPGVTGTGVAVFPTLETKYKSVRKPLRTFQLIPNKHVPEEDWIGKLLWVEKSLYYILGYLSPQLETVYIEDPELWTSAKSQASASSGDLFKLSMLVGAMIPVVYSAGFCKPRLITVKEWKGQLPKEAVDKRIAKALGKEYKAHVSDAVGMGLYLQGWDNLEFWRKVKEGKVR
jgi:hypothetical protein